jgi:hypothetical protein
VGRLLLLDLVFLGLTIYSLIDCIQTDEAEIRNLPKIIWILLILFAFPLFAAGAIAWLIAGRPQGHRARGNVTWPTTQTSGFPEYERPARGPAPDDDPEFLADLKRSNAEHERMLKQWEDDLRRREERLRREGGDQPDSEAPPSP